tara:strand:- start:12 stop:227 length:216 start_codon:yes stop_codon:yes gene_type:complete
MSFTTLDAWGQRETQDPPPYEDEPETNTVVMSLVFRYDPERHRTLSEWNWEELLDVEEVVAAVVLDEYHSK